MPRVKLFKPKSFDFETKEAKEARSKKKSQKEEEEGRRRKMTRKK